MAEIGVGYITDYWAIHHSDLAVSERRARAETYDQARTWIDPNGYRLSDRIWQQKAGMRQAIDERIRQGIAAGEDALRIADDLTRFLTPEVAGQVTRAPGRGGNGSYPARRLVRTEITRAHGQATIESVRALGPHANVAWRLSPSHPERDRCDDRAAADAFGLGPGIYPADDVPPYPDHPMCMCRLQPEVSDDDDALVAAIREEFGLNDPLLAPIETALELLPADLDVNELAKLRATDLEAFLTAVLDSALGRTTTAASARAIAQRLGIDLDALVTSSVDLGAAFAGSRSMQAAVKRLERQARRAATVAKRERQARELRAAQREPLPPRINEPPIADWEVPGQRVVLPERYMREWGLNSNVVRVNQDIHDKLYRKHPEILHIYEQNPEGWLAELISRVRPDDIVVDPKTPPHFRWTLYVPDTDGQDMLVTLLRDKRTNTLELRSFFKPRDAGYRERRTTTAKERKRKKQKPRDQGEGDEGRESDR